MCITRGKVPRSLLLEYAPDEQREERRKQSNEEPAGIERGYKGSMNQNRAMKKARTHSECSYRMSISRNLGRAEIPENVHEKHRN